VREKIESERKGRKGKLKKCRESEKVHAETMKRIPKEGKCASDEVRDVIKVKRCTFFAIIEAIFAIKFCRFFFHPKKSEIFEELKSKNKSYLPLPRVSSRILGFVCSEGRLRFFKFFLSLSLFLFFFSLSPSGVWLRNICFQFQLWFFGNF
jgi:hypothetical protein